MGGVQRNVVDHRLLFVDFSQLNGGEWTSACLFGGYTDPLATMRSLNSRIDDRDSQRMMESQVRGFRLAQVEEYELAIGYIDLSNRARFVWFERGIGPRGK